MASPRMAKHICADMPKSPKVRYTAHETAKGVSWFQEIVCDGRALKAGWCSWCGCKLETDKDKLWPREK